MLSTEIYYHIYNHANGDDNLFREEKNYDFFLKKYHQHIDPIAETIAWCLMPNHFHLLVKIKDKASIASTFPKFKTLEKFDDRFISKQFANFFSSYTQAYNKVYKRRGSLFVKNFKRKAILKERYLRNVILYIHRNPVIHGFVENIADWTYSSFKDFPATYPELMTFLFGDDAHYQLAHCTKASDFNDYENLEIESS